MSDNAHQLLFRELLNILQPVSEAVAEPGGIRLLFAQIGWDVNAVTGLPIDQLQTVLQNFASALQLITDFAENPPDTLAEVREALDTVPMVLQPLRSIPNLVPAASRPPEFERVAADLLELLTVEYLVRHHTTLWRLLVLLTLAEEDDGASALISEVKDPSTGETVRYPHVRRRLRLERLGNLLMDPAAVLRTEYLPAGLATTGDAQQAAARLFGRLAGLLQTMGVQVLHGFTAGLGFDLGTVGNDIAAGMLTFGIPLDILDQTSAMVGATLALSPGERGNLGIVVVPFGALEVACTFPDWLVDIGLGAEVEAFTIGPGGLTLPENAPAGDIDLRVRLTKRAMQAGPSVLVGAAGGSHLEIGQFSITGEASLSPQAQDYGLLLEVGAGAIVIAAGDGDGFLQRILPPEGLRTAFDLALGWSNRKGLYFRGSANLEATLPINRDLAGVLRVESVYLALRADGSGVRATTAATVDVHLGPVKAVVERFGLEATLTFPPDGGNLGLAHLALVFKPPNGAGLKIDAAVVVGGGYLFFDPVKEQYAGVLQLHIKGGIAVTAIGLLTTRMPDGSSGFSLVAIIAGQFPPIQLGLGFTLSGLGGLLALNRTVAVDVLRAGIRNNTLGSLLFPPDPVANAPRIISDLQAVFPPARDRFVFGPMARLGWGAPTILTLDLGLIFEIPDPVRLLVLGRLQTVLPDEDHALVRLRMDALGVIDVERGQLALDATLFDSRLFGFPVTGSMALRLAWGANPVFLLSVGGCNPRFPALLGVPALARLSINLLDSEHARLRFEAYLALTSNTVQFGARIELYFATPDEGFSVAGLLAFDVLLQFAPFSLTADLGGMIAMTFKGQPLLSAVLTLTLTGPTPWHLWGTVRFAILTFNVILSIDVRVGDAPPPPPPSLLDTAALLGQVRAALADVRNWSAPLPADTTNPVMLQQSEAADDRLLLHPLARLAVRQQVAPLNRPVTKYGNTPLSEAVSFSVRAVRPDDGVPLASTPVREMFALGQYEDMSDDEKLARPSFEPAEAGLQLGSDAFDYDADVVELTAGVEYDTQSIDETGAALQVPAYTLSPVTLDALVTQGAAASAPLRRSGVDRYRDAAWRVA